KPYEGDLRRPDQIVENKILYDEREWRAVRFVTIGTDVNYSEAIKNRRLPDELNLKFASEDIEVILVKDQTEVEEIKEVIRKEQTLLLFEAVKDRIRPIGDFKEPS
ncbi:MAG: abortive infection system antitoxin AbiGi family protein, partial [bacterium]